jgi:hypothetical protein
VKPFEHRDFEEDTRGLVIAEKIDDQVAEEERRKPVLAGLLITCARLPLLETKRMEGIAS